MPCSITTAAGSRAGCSRSPTASGSPGLPVAAREQLTIALEMTDAIECQLGPVDLSRRAYARKQAGCRTPIDGIYGIGELTSVTILAELGDARPFQNSRDAVRYPGLDITVYQTDQHRSPGASQSRRTARVALGAP
jgi:transposase